LGDLDHDENIVGRRAAGWDFADIHQKSPLSIASAASPLAALTRSGSVTLLCNALPVIAHPNLRAIGTKS
jgi:hypothetical protein